jgi:hypothetical protein
MIPGRRSQTRRCRRRYATKMRKRIRRTGVSACFILTRSICALVVLAQLFLCGHDC